MKIYIASPYSHPDAAVRKARWFQACHYAGTLIRQGHVVFSPIAHSHPIVQCNPETPDTLGAWMEQDLPFVEFCDELHQLELDGWERSEGCRRERRHAYQWGKRIKFIEPSAEVLSIGALPVPETICEEADRLVSTDRQEAYSHPSDDFTRTGRMWGAILAQWAADHSQPIPARLVGLCMVALKISREVHKHKRDNLVDGCGYLKCCDLIENL